MWIHSNLSFLGAICKGTRFLREDRRTDGIGSVSRDHRDAKQEISMCIPRKEERKKLANDYINALLRTAIKKQKINICSSRKDNLIYVAIPINI